MRIDWSRWINRGNLNSQSYICGYCGNNVGTNHGYYNDVTAARIYICTFCGCPTFFYTPHDQFPGPLEGRTINNLPSDIENIYREIRRSLSEGNFTATELLGRKLIMHLSVNVAGAKEGESFVSYVQHLKDVGYVPPNGEKWLEFARKLGNEKNHEIKEGTKENSTKILKFVEVLLIFIYEFGPLEEEKPSK